MSHKIKMIERVSEWRLLQAEDSEWQLGFVPTMGALHVGHMSLVKKAKQENKLVAVSIFVNPAQFDNAEDLSKYPRTLERDLEMLQSANIDFVYLPQAKEIYGDDYRYRIQETELSRNFCGAHRPGHFEGVLTVVMKLFQIVKPKRSYFGEKDYQQLKLIEGMTKAFFLETEVIGLPTARDERGLALSSRNTRLSAEQKERAYAFAEILSETLSLPSSEVITQLEERGLKVDYVNDLSSDHLGDRYYRRLAAVWVDEIRLIDNRSLK